MRTIHHHSIALIKSLFALSLQPIFIALTILGNGIVLAFSAIFYLLENPVNPLVDEKMDAIWWAFTTVTTVGFGDIVPMTLPGRILGIILMLIGTALFACYVALITEVFLKIDLNIEP